jgi:hypothetical protein
MFWSRVCILAVAGISSWVGPSVADIPVVGEAGATNITPLAPADSNLGWAFYLSDASVVRTILVIIFGLAIVVAFIWGLKLLRDEQHNAFIRALVVIVIVIGSLILVTAGFTSQQIAPVFGLFGTIVGYMLGRVSSNDATNNNAGEN